MLQRSWWMKWNKKLQRVRHVKRKIFWILSFFSTSSTNKARYIHIYTTITTVNNNLINFRKENNVMKCKENYFFTTKHNIYVAFSTIQQREMLLKKEFNQSSMYFCYSAKFSLIQLSKNHKISTISKPAIQFFLNSCYSA